MAEAPLVERDGGLVPDGPGWFVVNALEARWRLSDAFGRSCGFEGDDHFAQVGVNIHVLEPGVPACMYHGEAEEEHFLVLSGECLLIVEGQERRLRAWDFFHCPPWTEHVFVGAGEGPCAIVMIGARFGGGVRYPVEAAALRHGAGVERETDAPAEAYAPFPRPTFGPYRPGDLAG